MASFSSSLLVLFLVALFLTPQGLAEINPPVEKAADEYDPNGYYYKHKPPYKKPYYKPPSYKKPPYGKHPPAEDNIPEGLADINPPVEKAADEYDPNGYYKHKPPYKKPYYKPPYKKPPSYKKPPYGKHPPVEDNNHF